jgi:hypothetical protein
MRHEIVSDPVIGVIEQDFHYCLPILLRGSAAERCQSSREPNQKSEGTYEISNMNPERGSSITVMSANVQKRNVSELVDNRKIPGSADLRRS